jgi:hypothetical protein
MMMMMTRTGARAAMTLTTMWKTATASSNYQFNLRHGRAGTKQRRSYDAGIAFAFVVTTCLDRFSLVSAKKAKELELVGKGASTVLTLPHPDNCQPANPYYPFLYPPRTSFGSGRGQA